MWEILTKIAFAPCIALSIGGIRSMLDDISALSHRTNFYRKSLVRYDHIMNRAMNSNLLGLESLNEILKIAFAFKAEPQ
jgi:DNA integrity scanning protein DisA with diadenylate cyclase activity